MGIYDEAYKKNFSLTLDYRAVLDLRQYCAVKNLSAWVDEKIREELMKTKITFKCKCGVEATPATWRLWKKVCPSCHKEKDYSVVEE